MRAIVVREFGGPEVMQVEERPDADAGAGQVLVRVRAAGVNPVDTYIRSGTYALKPPLPYTPGTDGAGEVEAVGAEVKDFKPGDRVYIAGDNIGAPAPAPTPSTRSARRRSCTGCRTASSFAQGAALGVPYATAYRALFKRANARPGETVLVHGASGGVGIAAVQVARAHGMTRDRHRRHRARPASVVREPAPTSSSTTRNRAISTRS